MAVSYYNEHDPFAADWLRALMAAGLIPAGDVDERDIRDVAPADLVGYRQYHFFAGIGGWSLALELAGWPDDEPVWTGSCPCQPFSAAGKRLGTADDRHLWPDFFRLIAECHPPIVFGEQVSGTAGRQWLAGVRADLERVGYAVGVADLPAASVGAPHIRQRLWWVADADGGLGDSGGTGLSLGSGPENRSGTVRHEGPSAASPNPWSDYVLVPCADGKTRRLESGCEPLVDGIPGRVGRLRAYGNAIVPQVAATFVEAYLDLRG